MGWHRLCPLSSEWVCHQVSLEWEDLPRDKVSGTEHAWVVCGRKSNKKFRGCVGQGKARVGNKQ